MTVIITGQVLAPLERADGEPDDPLDQDDNEEPRTPISEPHLVLKVQASSDTLVAIPVEPRRVSGKTYFKGYRHLSLEKVESLLNTEPPQLVLRAFQPRAITTFSDRDLDRRFSRQGGSAASTRLIKSHRWMLIEPLATGPDAELLLDHEYFQRLCRQRAAELLHDEAIANRIAADKRRSEGRTGRNFDKSSEAKLKRLVAEIRRAFFQYWAGGSVPGALTPFSERCGARGKPRKAGQAKRGRPTLVLEGQPPVDRLNVVEGDRHAKNIKWCYDTWVGRRKKVSTALRRMWTDFYSVQVQMDDGRTVTEFLPPEQRPSRTQFEYWGTKGSATKAAWQRQLPPSEFDRNYRSIMGSARDDVYAVGQRGGIDSTPPDLQVVRATNRLARVGGGHRVLVIDSLFGYIPGVYMGFDAPSAATVKLALFNALDTDKQGWLDDLELDLPAEDFIPMWFANLWADNTDLRCEEVMLCARGVNTNIGFVPKLRSDLNSVVESGHHRLHRLVDHELSGSTYGQPKHRAELSATDRARHTMMTALRETVRAIHYHNTEEVEAWRPLRMRLKDVPPTRLAMTKEMIRQGRVASLANALDLGRKHLLPRYRGTFSPKGVRLHHPESREKIEFISGIVYTSAHPLVIARCEEARRGGKHDPDYFRDEFIVNPYRPRHIWYLERYTGECVQLEIRTLGFRDDDLPYELTLPEINDRGMVESVEGRSHAESRQRRRAALEAAQRAANADAEVQYQEAVRMRGAEPTRAEAKRDKRANRATEKSSALHGVPLPDRGSLPSASSDQPLPEGDDATRDQTAGLPGLPQQPAHRPSRNSNPFLKALETAKGET